MNLPVILLSVVAAIKACSASGGSAMACADKNCAFTAAGTDMKSCQFAKPIQACLKDKEFLIVRQDNFKWDNWFSFGISCKAGVGTKLDSESDDDLRSFDGGSEVHAASVEPLCSVAAFPCSDKNDICQSTPLGSDGKSCQFEKPVRMCLKDKTWRQVTAKDGKWAAKKQGAVGCQNGEGVARLGDSKEDLSKSFKAGGYSGGEDTKAITKTCEPLSADVAFGKDASTNGWKSLSLENLLAYFREQASPAVLKKVSEVVSKAISKQ